MIDDLPGVPDRQGHFDQSVAASEDDDLRTSLVALTRLAMGQMGPEDILTRVAELAVSAIPGADGAGLTLRADGQVDTIVASAPFVAEVYAIQYGIAEGPCITSAAQARTVRSGNLDTDPQWPRFGTRIGRLGVHSALSVPLPTRAGVLGAMTVYAHERDAFDERGLRIGELFAVPAAIAVQNAQALVQTKRLATQLQVALTNQAAIDQACGILMSRLGCSAAQALDHLRDASQTQEEQAVRRRAARGRGCPPSARQARARATVSSGLSFLGIGRAPGLSRRDTGGPDPSRGAEHSDCACAGESS